MFKVKVFQRLVMGCLLAGFFLNCTNEIIYTQGDAVPSPVPVQSDCITCHGSTSSEAPPQDTLGNTDTSFTGVGAHQTHLSNTTLHVAFECSTCHNVPDELNSVGHIDTALPAELNFSNLANSGGVSSTWNGMTCANSYCHGNFDGGNNTSPLWTTVNGSQAACGSCHDISPNSGQHQDDGHVGQACSVCHGTGYSELTVRIADHVNGIKNVGGAGSQINTWNGNSCSPTCHGNRNW